METNELNKNLNELNQRLQRITSRRYIFFSSVLKGVGSAIGATIIVALLLGLMNRIIAELGGFPFLEGILQNAF